jgi:hypothetical protein
VAGAESSDNMVASRRREYSSQPIPPSDLDLSKILESPTEQVRLFESNWGGGDLFVSPHVCAIGPVRVFGIAHRTGPPFGKVEKGGLQESFDKRDNL